MADSVVQEGELWRTLAENAAGGDEPPLTMAAFLELLPPVHRVPLRRAAAQLAWLPPDGFAVLPRHAYSHHDFLWLVNQYESYAEVCAAVEAVSYAMLSRGRVVWLARLALMWLTRQTCRRDKRGKRRKHVVASLWALERRKEYVAALPPAIAVEAGDELQRVLLDMEGTGAPNPFTCCELAFALDAARPWPKQVMMRMLALGFGHFTRGGNGILLGAGDEETEWMHTAVVWNGSAALAEAVYPSLDCVTDLARHVAVRLERREVLTVFRQHWGKVQPKWPFPNDLADKPALREWMVAEGWLLDAPVVSGAYVPNYVYGYHVRPDRIFMFERYDDERPFVVGHVARDPPPLPVGARRTRLSMAPGQAGVCSRPNQRDKSSVRGTYRGR